MDIFRAVDEFVSSGIRLFKQLRGEGLSLSQLDLLNLAGPVTSPTDRNHSSQESPIPTPQDSAVPVAAYTPRF